MPSKWISLAEASRILGIAPNTVRRLVERGTLPAFKIQGVAGYRFQREQVEALIQLVVVGPEKKQKHREKAGQLAPRSRSKRTAR
jgi:excisionase family DNA binding protein